jgi:hypothetical protein
MLAATPALADDTVPWGKGEVAGWDIAVDQSLGGGCFILALFDGNAIVRIGFDPGNSDYYLMLSDADWQSIEAGKDYDLKLTLGRRAPWDAAATGIMMGDQPALLVRSTDADFIEEFSGQQNIRVEYAGSEIANLNLSGSAAALREMINCQSTMNENATAADPFKKTADPFAQ